MAVGNIFLSKWSVSKLFINVSTALLWCFGHLFISEWMEIQMRHNDRVCRIPPDSSPSRMHCTRTGITHLWNAHNHTYGTRAKIYSQLTHNYKYASQVLLYKHSHVLHPQPPKHFPGCKVNIKQQLHQQERTSFSKTITDKSCSGNYTDVAFYAQMVRLGN